jgi:hypothetical protein
VQNGAEACNMLHKETRILAMLRTNRKCMEHFWSAGEVYCDQSYLIRIFTFSH